MSSLVSWFDDNIVKSTKSYKDMMLVSSDVIFIIVNLLTILLTEGALKVEKVATS